MDKDSMVINPRRPRLGPAGVAPGSLKATSDMGELQRSRSVGGLPQRESASSRSQKLSKVLTGKRRAPSAHVLPGP